MCLFVTRATKSSFAPASLHELDRVYELFERCSSTSRTAANNLVSDIFLILPAHAHRCLRPLCRSSASRHTPRHPPKQSRPRQAKSSQNLTGLAARPTSLRPTAPASSTASPHPTPTPAPAPSHTQYQAAARAAVAAIAVASK